MTLIKHRSSSGNAERYTWPIYFIKHAFKNVCRIIFFNITRRLKHEAAVRAVLKHEMKNSLSVRYKINFHFFFFQQV